MMLMSPNAALPMQPLQTTKVPQLWDGVRSDGLAGPVKTGTTEE